MIVIISGRLSQHIKYVWVKTVETFDVLERNYTRQLDPNNNRVKGGTIRFSKPHVKLKNDSGGERF